MACFKGVSSVSLPKHRTHHIVTAYRERYYSMPYLRLVTDEGNMAVLNTASAIARLEQDVSKTRADMRRLLCPKAWPCRKTSTLVTTRVLSRRIVTCSGRFTSAG